MRDCKPVREAAASPFDRSIVGSLKMKQKRRHELQTNELADQLGHYIEDIRPYYNHILIGILSVAVLISVLIWWNNSKAKNLGASWGDYFNAASSREPSAMDEVAKLHPGTPAAVWAHISAGDLQLAKGVGLMFRDRDEAKDVLDEAEQHYLAAVEGGAEDDPWLMERTQYGLGQVCEARSEVEKAIGYYQAAAAIDADSVIGKAAQKRADLLADSDVAGWYNWFDRQEPPTPGDMPGGSGLGPNLPGNLESLPDRPDLSFPGSDSPLSSDDTPAGDLPLSPDDVLSTGTPAGDDAALDMDLTAPATDDSATDDSATADESTETTEPATTEAEEGTGEAEPDSSAPTTDNAPAAADAPETEDAPATVEESN